MEDHAEVARLFDDIKDIDDYNDVWTLFVRIVDIWSIISKFKQEHFFFLRIKQEHIEMVVMDA